MFKSEVDNEYFNNALKNLDIDAVSKVQKWITKEDLTSLVYLLYESQEAFTALDRLLQQEQHGEDKLDLLLDWVNQACKSCNEDENWKLKFLEAITLCQLFSVIKRLGFSVTFVKSYFRPDTIHFAHTLNPVKKALYKLADNITCQDLVKIKNAFDDKEIKSYEQCELIFLRLEINKTITITNNGKGLNKLINIFKINFKELYCEYLKQYDIDHQNDSKVTGSTTPSETDDQPTVELIRKMLAELNVNNEHLKSDTYQINSKKRIGLCHIINQEIFNSPCPETYAQLDNRTGSSQDKDHLTKIMNQLNYKVIINENLPKDEVLQSIKLSIQEHFVPNDSIYILFILSHGIKGHVYGTDCIPINLDVIKDTIDCNKLQGFPKVVIIQACQEDNQKDWNMSNMQADGPNNKPNTHYIKGSDFLIYWATSPYYQAFRQSSRGSIFIQILCFTLKLFPDHSIHDIFTKVTYFVTKIFSEKTDKDQLPLFESTLRKKLYLKKPS